MAWIRLITVLAVAGAVLCATAQAAEPLFERRALYCPAHFGNSYEVMGEREMRDMLAEAKHWGFNRYGDWFDTVDCSDPFVDPHYNMGRALWDKKKRNFQSAQELGLKCELIITPNHVFLDQCRPDLLAKEGKGIFGQLICPSIPEAREIILRNYENIFRDLADAGVRLSALCPCPYDYGGCACDKCAPWILTFAELTKEIGAIAEQYHPGIEMHFIGWWWKDEEHALFAEWADHEAPGWVKSISLHIPYGKTGVSDVPLPEGCERQAFVHNGYADQAQPRDTYGHLGPVMAAERLPATVAGLKAHGVTGFMAYSEGIYEDVNKAILGGITSGRFGTAAEALQAYAKRYLGAEDETAAAWAAWFKPWGRPFEVNAARALDELAALCEATGASGWRVRHWELKAEMLRLNAMIMSATDWTPERLALVEQFWATRETLDREVYGLGPVRHIFNYRFARLPWHDDWSRYMAEAARKAEDEM